MNKTEKTLEQIIYEVLKGRPFCDCNYKESNIYDAYCLRVAETVMMYLEEK